jgi:peptide/nickel transport system permease protein
MRAILEALKEVSRYKSAVVGLILIAILVIVAIYTVFAIPYSEVVRLWRGGEGMWLENPKNALPSWVNLFPGTNLPKTIIVSSRAGGSKSVEPLQGGVSKVRISLPFDYSYDGFPKELNLFFEAKYKERQPHLSISWVTPDGRKIPLSDRSAKASDYYYISLDSQLAKKLRDLPPQVGLFADPLAEKPVPFKGRYELVIDGYLFEEGADLEAKLVVYGQVYGLAGTDHLRRDLMIAMLWGTPTALAFGILAALGTTVLTLFIAAAGVWFGGWVDAAIQRITEVNMILPMLPILILIGTLYSRSVWLMLGMVIILSIFGAGIKTYRAMFLQIKQAPYLEAARAYGARNLRIVLRYMVPKAIPTLIPQFVMLIPGYVFLEASLAVLGLGDPILPTWGKVIQDAEANGALYLGHYYWVLEPSLLLMVTGLGFAMVGFALDRVFNPKLRQI